MQIGTIQWQSMKIAQPFIDTNVVPNRLNTIYIGPTCSLLSIERKNLPDLMPICFSIYSKLPNDVWSFGQHGLFRDTQNLEIGNSNLTFFE